MAAPRPKPPPSFQKRRSDDAAPQFESGPAVEAAAIASMQNDLERARGEYVLRRYESALLIITDLVNKLRAMPAKGATAERVFLTASALCMQGRLHAIRGDKEKACEAFEESVALFESRANDVDQVKTATRTRTDYGIALFRIGRTQEAIEILKLIGESGPTPAEAFGYLGLAYNKAGRNADAEMVFRKGLQLAPTDPKLLQYLAETLDRPDNTEQAAAAYREAAVAVMKEDMEEAARLATRALAITPTDMQSLATAVIVERARGDLARCLDLVESFLEHETDSAWARGVKGMLLRESGQLEKAISTLRSIDVQTRDLAWILVELAEAMKDLDPDCQTEALQLLERALDLDPNLPGAEYVKAQIYVARNEFSSAIKALQRALELQPQSALLWTELGTAQLFSGDTKSAGEAFSEALKLEPRSAGALAGRAQILRREGHLDEATEALRRALHVTPNNSTIFHWLIDVLLEQSLADEALDELDAELQRNPKAIRAYSRKGEILVELQRLEEAVEVFETALTLDPDNSGLLVSLADTLRGLDRYDEAGQVFDRGLALQPDSSYILGSKAFYLTEIAAFAAAAKLLDVAMNTASTPEWRAWLSYLRGWSAQELGPAFADQARKCFEAALESDQNNVWYRKGLADTLCQLGPQEQREARRHFEMIIEQQKYKTRDDADLLAGLGWCHYRLDRYDEAVRLLHASLSLEKDPVVQFDLALVLLASSRSSLALSAYRSATALAVRKHILRQRGLYHVALFDVVEAALKRDLGTDGTDVFNFLRRRLHSSGVELSALDWLGTRLPVPNREQPQREENTSAKSAASSGQKS